MHGSIPKGKFRDMPPKSCEGEMSVERGEGRNLEKLRREEQTNPRVDMITKETSFIFVHASRKLHSLPYLYAL